MTHYHRRVGLDAVGGPVEAVQSNIAVVTGMFAIRAADTGHDIAEPTTRNGTSFKKVPYSAPAPGPKTPAYLKGFPDSRPQHRATTAPCGRPEDRG